MRTHRSFARRLVRWPFAVSAFALAGCGSDETSVRRVYEVAPDMVVCQGVAYQLCLKVREPGDSGWTPMYEQPDRFDFEWGVATRIVVEERAREDGIVDAGSVHRTLVAVEHSATVAPDTTFTLHLPGGVDSEALLGRGVHCPYTPAEIEPRQVGAEVRPGPSRAAAARAGGAPPAEELRCRELDDYLQDDRNSVLLTVSLRRRAVGMPSVDPFPWPMAVTFVVEGWEPCDSPWPTCLAAE